MTIHLNLLHIVFDYNDINFFFPFLEIIIKNYTQNKFGKMNSIPIHFIQLKFMNNTIKFEHLLRLLIITCQI